jgi:hypothetical protein
VTTIKNNQKSLLEQFALTMIFLGNHGWHHYIQVCDLARFQVNKKCYKMHYVHHFHESADFLLSLISHSSSSSSSLPFPSSFPLPSSKTLWMVPSYFLLFNDDNNIQVKVKVTL